VLATYGRLFGTPFNLQFLIADFMFSYIMGMAIGERPAGTRQRRSEFLVALLWVAGSGLLMSLAPPSMPTLSFWVGLVDRTVWRAAYLALVDDIIGVLARPNVRTLKGKVTLILVQSFTITSLVYFALLWVQRIRAGQGQPLKSA
jgi:predicted small integral membrane protein